MRLQPNDILRKGDMVIQTYTDFPISYVSWGMAVAEYVRRLPCPSAVWYIERPEPDWKAAYERLFETNEKHVAEIERLRSILRRLQTRETDDSILDMYFAVKQARKEMRDPDDEIPWSEE